MSRSLRRTACLVTLAVAFSVIAQADAPHIYAIGVRGW